jgi:serine/threonine protein kinase
MPSYTTDELKALLAGQLSPERESEIALNIELDSTLRNRLELLSGSGLWSIGSAPVPTEPSSPKLASVIERVVSESRIERVSGSGSTGETASTVDMEHCEPLLVPGIRIVREIGRGGMGVVYEGWDELVGRKVAIKRLLPIRSSNSNAKDRMLQEARAAGALLHPNIVSIYGVQLQEDMPILVQQFVEGETLQSRIDTQCYLSWQECADVAKQIALGLGAAHAAGIIHRDLKPDNILIEDKTNIVRIADFGIALHSRSSGLTGNDHVAGTPAYMSPEQTGGEALDARSDLFSLGSVLVAAATGQPPFGLDDPFVVMDRIRNQEATSIKSLRPDYPDWLSGVIDRLLSKDRQHRIANAEALLTAISLEVDPQNTTPAANPFRRLLLAVALCALAMLPVFAWWSSSVSKTSQAGNGQTMMAEVVTPPFIPSKPVWIRRNNAEFDSLASAVESAIDGDTIEIGQDLECIPMTIQSKHLTLKGSASYRPLLTSAESNNTENSMDAYFLRAESDLTLDGIDIDWQTTAQVPLFNGEKILNAVVGSAPGTRMTIRDCKIHRSPGGVCVAVGGNLGAKNSTFSGASVALAWLGHHSQVEMENCELAGRIGVAIMYPLANVVVYKKSQLNIKHSIIRAVDAVSPMLSRQMDVPVELRIQDSILDSKHTVSLISLSNVFREKLESLPVVILKSSIEWHESRCVYDVNCEHLITRRIKNVERRYSTNVSNLKQWQNQVHGEVENDSSSIGVHLTRRPDEPSSIGQPLYHMVPTTEQPLPPWARKAGPMITNRSEL